MLAKTTMKIVFETTTPKHINQDDDDGDADETVNSCASLKKNGQPCGRATKPGEAYCFWHMSTCKAVTSKGTKCSNGCMEGTDACVYHAATCTGTTKAGTPCQMAAEFCRYHRNENQAAQISNDDVQSSASESRTSGSVSVGKHQCQGTTKKGLRCRLKVGADETFCHFHA